VADQLGLMGEIKVREWAAMAGIGFLMFGIVSSSLHKMTPPWLGFAVLFSLLLCGTLRKQEFKENVDWTFLLYLSGITGIVATFNHLGIDSMLGKALPGLGSLMHENMGMFILLLFLLVQVLRLLVPINATVVILAAIFMPLAEINGVNSWVIGFIILMFSETWFLPFQCSYYLQLQEMNRERAMYDERTFLLVNAGLNLARLVAVYASLPYWKILGLL
jgi:DASS family divalent anion:Na+ symporter